MEEDMRTKDITGERIPMFVESPRGDDKIGTDANTGSLISDHEASEKGVPFEAGVPKEKIQEAVETELRGDKWVVIERKDGSSDLLTKKDIPQPEKEEEKENVSEEEIDEDRPSEEETGTGGSDASEKPGDDWRGSFGAVPVKPKAAAAIVKPASTVEPKKEKEVWKSKFDNIKSATATHKGKGG
jgi:hypothetical protein